jgi:hypothetical protein
LNARGHWPHEFPAAGPDGTTLLFRKLYHNHGDIIQTADLSSLGNCLYNDYEFDYRDRLPQPMTSKGGIEVLKGISR